MPSTSRHSSSRLAALAVAAFVVAACGCGGDHGPAHDAAAEVRPVDAGSLAELCTQTGGTVGSELCCGATSDFPDTCGVGSCGCSPSASHEVDFCTCPNGTCFTPDKGCHAP